MVTPEDVEDGGDTLQTASLPAPAANLQTQDRVNISVWI